ncbi:MAG: transporter substrate-binding domain-containing protein [Pseudomonadota bacterium]
MKKLSLFLVALWFCLPARAEVPHVVRACGDSAEFPPFQYFERQSGHKTNRVAGFDVDLLRRVFTDAGHEVQIDLLPWLRCLALTSRGDYDIAMDGIKSPVRERDFLFATSHYSLTSVFIYLKSNRKPRTESSAALATERVCSQAGYNYAPFGVPDSMIRNRAKTLDDAAKMLRLGRCSVMLQQVEVLRGSATLGNIDLLNQPDFLQEYPTWMRPIDFHFMVSRTLPHREALLDIINDGMARLEKSGELSRIRGVHYRPAPQSIQKAP